MTDEERIQQLKADLAALEAKVLAERSVEAPIPTPSVPTSAHTGKGPKPGLIILGIVGLIIVGWLVSQPASHSPNTVVHTSPAGSVQPTSTPGPPPPPPTPWTYSASTDALTDGTTNTACTRSSNMVELNSPYESVFARLCIRQSPRFGLDTYVTLEGDGQILCRSYEDCTLKVRFDDATARNWPGVGAADGSSNIVFLRRSQGLVTGIKDAKRVVVELPMYEAGNQPIIFPTQELEWPRPPKP